MTEEEFELSQKIDGTRELIRMTIALAAGDRGISSTSSVHALPARSVNPDGYEIVCSYGGTADNFDGAAWAAFVGSVPTALRAIGFELSGDYVPVYDRRRPDQGVTWYVVPT